MLFMLAQTKIKEIKRLKQKKAHLRNSDSPATHHEVLAVQGDFANPVATWLSSKLPPIKLTTLRYFCPSLNPPKTSKFHNYCIYYSLTWSNSCEHL